MPPLEHVLESLRLTYLQRSSQYTPSQAITSFTHRTAAVSKILPQLRKERFTPSTVEYVPAVQSTQILDTVAPVSNQARTDSSQIETAQNKIASKMTVVSLPSKLEYFPATHAVQVDESLAPAIIYIFKPARYQADAKMSIYTACIGLISSGVKDMCARTVCSRVSSC